MPQTLTIIPAPGFAVSTPRWGLEELQTLDGAGAGAPAPCRPYSVTR